MSGVRQRRKKMKVVNTAFFLGNVLNGMLDDGVYDNERHVFTRYDRRLYRLRKRIIHWQA